MKLSFWIAPFDSGIRVLKSNKYFQLAEAVQIDYLIKVRKFFNIFQSTASFVKVAPLFKFAKAVSIVSRIRVETQLIHADDKCAYFAHVMYSRKEQVAEVLVKMIFKVGRIAVAPSLFLLVSFAEVPEKVLGIESALATL